MEYTFVACFRPKPSIGRSELQELVNRAGTSVYEVLHTEPSGSIPIYWLLQVKTQELDNIDVWTNLYKLVGSLASKQKVLFAGIVFSPAEWLCFGATRLRGYNSARHISDIGAFWYQIQSDTHRVPADSVGVFLTTDMNRREKNGHLITARQWLEFQSVIYKFDRLFRLKKKLDQLRGARNNPGMFERLSTEIIELAERII